MPVTLTCALANGFVGPVPDVNGMLREDVVITPNGTNSGDTGTYTCQFLNPDRVNSGGLEYSISGKVVTFKATSNMDNGFLETASIYGYAT